MLASLFTCMEGNVVLTYFQFIFLIAHSRSILKRVHKTELIFKVLWAKTTSNINLNVNILHFHILHPIRAFLTVDRQPSVKNHFPVSSYLLIGTSGGVFVGFSFSPIVSDMSVHKTLSAFNRVRFYSTSTFYGLARKRRFVNN